MTQSPVPVQAGWHQLSSPSAPPLRGWWAVPADRAPRAAVLVLPEVFGVNGWVRSVAERLAGEGYGALAMPIFSRTAPELDVGYDAAGLAEGRRHRDQLKADQFLADARSAIAWIQTQPGLEHRPIGCVGFCFGGHPARGGRLRCFCGDQDPLMPPEELEAIRTALAKAGQPPLVVAPGAGHGFMCEARADFHPAAAAAGWSQMLALFAETLEFAPP